MQLTGELKEKVEKAESAEETKKILEEAGVVLNDAELDQVSGGQGEKCADKPQVTANIAD